jgi:hypothetical protein
MIFGISKSIYILNEWDGSHNVPYLIDNLEDFRVYALDESDMSCNVP